MDTTKHQMSVVRCPLFVAADDREHGPRTTDDGRRTAFTLVELLVVITIIGILVGLITTAAVSALKKARQTEIKAEINQLDGGFTEAKNKYNAYPPNCQTDDTGPIAESRVLADMKRFMRQAFPRHQEPDDLIARLVGWDSINNKVVPQNKQLAGGMAGGEAIVFWLGGFSSDPKFPISGEGGPSYQVPSANGTTAGSTNYQLDPIESRVSKMTFPFKVDRLGPRENGGNTGFFHGEPTYTNRRWYEYTVTIPGQNNNQPQTRRINLWQYKPRKSDQAYVYFDTSRYAPPTSSIADMTQPPAATALGIGGKTTDPPFYVFPLVKRNDSASTSANLVLQYINPDKFQILHCGINDRWDQDFFKNSISVQYSSNFPTNIILFPDGPFTGDMADAIVNFTTETRIEDAQKQ